MYFRKSYVAFKYLDSAVPDYFRNILRRLESKYRNMANPSHSHRIGQNNVIETNSPKFRALRTSKSYIR